MKEALIYVSHILNAISDIKEFTKEMNREEFLNNKMAEHAVVRNIEIIGEASKNLSKEFREQHKDIPWQDIIKMRNKVTHFYLSLLQKSEKENCLSFPRKWESSIFNGLCNTLDSRFHGNDDFCKSLILE